eukprot:COSAG01_NODE_1029_length_12019_cov_560.144631_5_plen_102_part_00
MSHSCACIGSPCLRQCVHGAPTGGGGGGGAQARRLAQLQGALESDDAQLEALRGELAAAQQHEHAAQHHAAAQDGGTARHARTRHPPPARSQLTNTPPTLN